MAKFLVKNHFSIYHFRFILPIELQEFTGKRELKKSLRTSDLKKASYYAQRLAYKLKPILTGCLMNFTEMKTLLDQEYFKILAEEIETLNKVGPYDDSIGEPSDLIDLDEEGIAERTGQLLGDASEDKVYAYKKMLVEVTKAVRAHVRKLSSYSPAPLISPVSTGTTTTAPTLSQLISDFTSRKDATKGWRTTTRKSYLATFGILLELLGDKPISELSAKDAETFLAKLQKLPANINSGNKRGSKTLEQLIAEGQERTLSDRTINNKLIHVTALFNHATKQGLIPKNVFSGLKLKGSTSEVRAEFTGIDLASIFEHTMKEEGHKFWVPLLLYYTGARLEEITQLHASDIKGNYIDINNIEGKQLKNQGSKRKIPIHPQLIELGFIEYARKQKGKLFPELPPNNDGKTSAKVSKWLNRIIHRVTKSAPTEKKVAHCFRHTFINSLKQSSVEEAKIKALVGHKDDSITTGLYGKEYPVETLAEVVKLIPNLPAHHV